MFPEPVKVIRVVPMGNSVKLVGQGMSTGFVHQPILTPAQLANLAGSPEQEPFDGDAIKFKLGVEALRLGIAYEYDPCFSLSIRPDLEHGSVFYEVQRTYAPLVRRLYSSRERAHPPARRKNAISR